MGAGQRAVETRGARLPEAVLAFSDVEASPRQG